MVCEAGHHFDRAREGYWSLLQPQDRKSAKPGDPETAVLARHRWLSRGYASGLIESLLPWTVGVVGNQPREQVRIVDLGCGEGSFGPALFASHAAGYCGIDLSKRAIRLASRRWPAATWVLANADRVLPVRDASVDCVVSLFGRRPVAEIKRVLVPEGFCVVAVPGEQDLIELREQVQQAGHRRSRWECVVEEMSAAGLKCVEHKHWKQHLVLDSDAISDAMAMTYRAVRYSQQARLESVSEMQVTMAADLLLLQHAV